MKFNLKQLEAFVWVADLGSFRKAAARLNTTQPNISARIASLEEALQVTLMERDAGSVRLTAKGQEILKLSWEILQKGDALVEAAGHSSLYDGTIRLGVTEMVVHTWLREFLKVLKDRFPNITVELTVDLSVNLKKQLPSRSIDLAFLNGPFQSQTSGSVILGTYPWIWVASSAMRNELKGRVSIEKLTQNPILTHARDTRPFEEVSEHFTERRDLGVRLVPSSNLATCLHMVVDGMGVAALPAAMVRKELTNGELVEIDYSWKPQSLEFQARYDAQKSPGIVAKAAVVAAEIAQQF